MELIQRVMPRDYVLIDSSDYHYGSLNCAREKIKEMVNKVATKKNYFLVNKGDSIEAILPNDKRYASCGIDIKEALLTPAQQADAVVQDFMPIKDKIVAWGFGNHEYKLLNTMDFGRYIANQLQVPYGTYAFKFTATDRNQRLMHKMFFTHGYGSINSCAKDEIQKKANRQASLKHKLCKSGFSDCIYLSCGHCFSADTEIYTRNGWVTYDGLTVGDEVVTINMRTELAEWNTVKQIHIHEDKFDTLIQCQTDKVDFAVTDGHRIIYKSGVSRGLEEGYAKDVQNRSITFIPVSAFTDDNIQNEILLNDDQLRLAGWLISEGHFRENGAVQLFQSEAKIHLIEELLSRLGIPYSKYTRDNVGREFECPHSGRTYQTKQISHTIYISIDNAKDIISYQPNKQIQDWAFTLNDHQFECLFETLILGDGNRPKDSVTACRYYTNDRHSADTLQALCNMHGWKAAISERKGGFELACVKQQFATVSKQASNNRNRGTTYQNVPATSVVWCPSVDNGTVLVRRNGKSCFMGNTHQLMVVDPTIEDKLYLTDDGHGIKQHYHVQSEQNIPYIPPDSRWFGCSGSFLKLYSTPGSYAISYAEVAGYEPSEIGWLEVHVQDGNVVKVDKVIA